LAIRVAAARPIQRLAAEAKSAHSGYAILVAAAEGEHGAAARIRAAVSVLVGDDGDTVVRNAIFVSMTIMTGGHSTALPSEADS
jgi:hypothetical protein